MKSEKNELLRFIGGLVMLAAGLFILSQKVYVTSGLFGYGGFSIGGLRLNSGLVIVPFIIGVVWMFATGSFGSKVFTVLSVIWIITSIVMSTSFYFSQTTLYEWILILILIFGGAGLVARCLFAGKSSSRGEKSVDDMIKEEMKEAKKKGNKRDKNR